MKTLGNRFRAVAGSVVAVTAIAIGVALVQAQHPGSPPGDIASPAGGKDSLTLVEKPCPGAEAVEITDLARSSLERVRMWVPIALAASAKEMKSWRCGGGTPLLTYPHVRISFENGWSDVAIPQKWERMVSDNGEGYIVKISGRPAMVEPPSAAAPRGQVLLVVGDTLIRVLGDGKVPADDLIAIAASMELDAPLA